MAYSVRSAAKVLDLSVRTVWDLVSSGELPSFKIGASRRILRAEMDAYLKRKATEATHPPAGPSTPPPPPGPKSAQRAPLRRAG